MSSEELQDVELFVFTDNLVSESVFYKGTSKIPLPLVVKCQKNIEIFALGVGNTLHVRLCGYEVVTQITLRIIYPR